MYILFVGQTCVTGGGPSNVNEGYIDNLTSDFTCINRKNKILRYIEAIVKILFVKVVVISGLSKFGLYCILFAKLFNKKTVYIMHGCADYEIKINNTHNEADPIVIKIESNYLKKVDKILAVSKQFSIWLRENYPQYTAKIDFLFNGVIKPNIIINDNTKIKNSLIAVGGDRGTKNNKTVCNAVEKFEGIYKLKVFGSIYGDICPVGYKYSKYLGWVSQDQLHSEMEKSELFIINSIFEPFSLSVFEALSCKCSILISQYVGAIDLLDIKESDIIYDPNNEEEIGMKIAYLLEHPNYERLLASIDYDKLSYKVRATELENKCKLLIK